VLLPTRPAVPAVGLEAVVGLDAVVGLVVVTCGRVALALGRDDALPLPTRPVEALPEAVGRVLLVPLIEPLVVRPETEAPFWRPLVPLGRRPLIEPEALLPCLTLAT